MDGPCTRIVIVDDHAVVRQGLEQIVKGDKEIMLVGEASTGAEAVALIDKVQFDVMVLDISMPGRSGLDILRDVRQRKCGFKVLVMSMHSEERYGARVLRAGADGYLTKDSAAEALILAIRKIAAGRKYVSPMLAERLAGELLNGEVRAPHELLSHREYEIFEMIAQGSTNSDIASALNLGVNTISTYRSRVLQKLELRNNAEIIQYALHNDLMD